MKSCPICFEKNMNRMNNYFDENVTLQNNDLMKIVNQLFSVKRHHYGEIEKQKIIIKQLNADGQLEQMKQSVCNKLAVLKSELCHPFTYDFIRERGIEVETYLQELFLHSERLGGASLCPNSRMSLKRFMKFIDGKESMSSSIFHLILMNLDIQPIILKVCVVRIN